MFISHSENHIFKFAAFFIPSFLVLTTLSGLLYWSVQQNLRIGANDPQIQLAEDTASKLEANNQPQSVIPGEKVNLAKSLAPFLITYNKHGDITASSVQLQGITPALPKGVLDSVSKNGEERLTWQPESNIRIASVVTPFSKGFVLAGRSLREVEIREDKLMLGVFALWLGTGFLLFLIALVLATSKPKIISKF